MVDIIDEIGNYAIPAPRPEEDAASTYMEVEGQREANDLDQWLSDTLAENVTEPTEQPAQALEPQPGEDDNRSTAARMMLAGPEVIKDITHGLVEAPGQVLGGAVDAIGEVGELLGELTGIGGVQFYDEDEEGNFGKFNPRYLTFEEFQEVGGDSLINAISTKPADSVTGGFVRATGQFLSGFIPAVKGIKTIALLSKSRVIAPVAAGMIADSVVFDPHEARLSTFLNEIPSLEPYVSDYLADNNPENESSWEGRLKNAIEGIGMGLVAEAVGGLIKGFKYYKLQRANKFMPDDPSVQAEAGRDALQAAAREDIVVDIPQEDFLPLGDPNGSLIVEGDVTETAATAFQRVSDADARAALSVEQNDALGRVNAILETFEQAAKEGESPFDEMIDMLRTGQTGATAAEMGGKRPVAAIVKGLGGVAPGSNLAAELKALGITTKTHPGLFRKGGLTALDKIPVEDQPLFLARQLDDGQGNIPEGSFLEALEAEARGEPWLDLEQQAFFDEVIAPMADLDEQLQRLGIDISEMSNARIKEVIQETADEEAAFARAAEEIPEADIDGLGATPEGRVFINHARINTPDDVKAVLQEMADLDAVAIEVKQGGVVTNPETIAASAAEYQDITDLIGRQPGPMTASQAVAARKLLVSSGEQLVELARRASAADASKADIYNFRRAVSVHYAIQSEVIAARTETARALQSWAIPADGDKVRAQAITDLVMDSGGAGDLQSLARAFSETAGNPAALNAMAAELGRGRFGKALYQVWINGLLSSPKTHAVNIMSNAMVAMWAIPERYLAAGVSRAFYGGDIVVGEVAAQAYGLLKGVRDGARLVYHGNKAEGIGDLADVFDAFAKTEIHGNAVSAEAFGADSAGVLGRGIDMLGRMVAVPGSMLGVEDRFFKSIGYRMELNALAYRRATAEGLEGQEFAERVADILLNPPAELRADALDAAAYQTFTRPLGKTGQAFQEAIRRIPGARLVLPFVRTPTNIVKFTFERTPLAYMSGAVRADIKAGGARAAQAQARIAMGSMLMMVIGDMATEETISGRGPSDFRLRQLKMDEGWMPYSAKVGDRWYQYSRTDPIGMMMGLGADIAEIITNANNEDSEMLATAGVMALANNLANKTYMSGIYDFIGAIDPSNPSNSPGKYLTDFTGSMMPFSSFLRNVTNVADPIIRDARVPTQDIEGKDDPVGAWFETIMNNQRKVIPGLSDELPAKLDLFGEEISRASGLGIAWDFISPIASRVDDPDAVVQAMVDNQVAISAVPRSINGVQLTPEEYHDFAQEAGQSLKEELDALVSSQGFAQLSDGPDGMKAETIRDAVHRHRSLAKAMMIQSSPRLRDLIFQRQSEKLMTLQGEQ